FLPSATPLPDNPPMADLVYLSLSLREFSEQTMLGYWRQAIDEFPASPQFPGVCGLTVYPLDWSAAPALEQTFLDGVSGEQALTVANEFLHEDYAYEAQMRWDLWTPKSSQSSEGWQQESPVVSLMCLGDEFDPEGLEGPGHLKINFGPDSAFLPPEEWQLSAAELRQQLASPNLRQNIEKLISYVHGLEKRLPVSKRLLYCESGENLAEKILSFWELKI
ncbi:MAG: hypothetical protein HY648_10680, partial [Acidobacteria bacterium]|nr:hypothetical protein [Acidobacteriota bacterium]